MEYRDYKKMFSCNSWSIQMIQNPINNHTKWNIEAYFPLGRGRSFTHREILLLFPAEYITKHKNCASDLLSIFDTCICLAYHVLATVSPPLYKSSCHLIKNFHNEKLKFLVFPNFQFLFQRGHKIAIFKQL